MCTYPYEDLHDYIDGCLPADRINEIGEHISKCPDCRQYYHSQVLVSQYLKQEVSSSIDVRHAVMLRIDKERYPVKGNPSIMRAVGKCTVTFARPVVLMVSLAVLVLILSYFIRYDPFSKTANHWSQATSSAESEPAFSHDSEHFSFYSNEQNQQVFSELTALFEANYQRIARDLDTALPWKVTVKIWQDEKTFYDAIGRKSENKGVMSGRKGSAIHVLQPPGGAGGWEATLGAAELTHIMIAEINPLNNVLWVHDSIELYEAVRFDRETVTEGLADYVQRGDVPDLDKLMGHYEAVPFGEVILPTLPEFVLDTFGPEKLKGIIKDPMNPEKVLGLSLKDFSRSWLDYLEKSYQVRFIK